MMAHAFAKIEVRAGAVRNHTGLDAELRMPRRPWAMPRHAAAVRVVVLATVVLAAMAMTPGARLAADTACLEEPEAGAPLGEHWYYHFDQQKNRKCWHLGTPATFFQPSASRRSDRSSFSLSAAFTPFLRQMRNAFRQPEPHEHAAGEPRIVQSDPTRLLTIDDVARQPEFQFPEERAETRPVLFLNAEQRRALYEEYMKWEALQRDAARAPAP